VTAAFDKIALERQMMESFADVFSLEEEPALDICAVTEPALDICAVTEPALDICAVTEPALDICAVTVDGMNGGANGEAAKAIADTTAEGAAVAGWAPNAKSAKLCADVDELFTSVYSPMGAYNQVTPAPSPLPPPRPVPLLALFTVRILSSVAPSYCLFSTA
jgi:hypothetical protein